MLPVFLCDGFRRSWIGSFWEWGRRKKIADCGEEERVWVGRGHNFRGGGYGGIMGIVGWMRVDWGGLDVDWKEV